MGIVSHQRRRIVEEMLLLQIMREYSCAGDKLRLLYLIVVQ